MLKAKIVLCERIFQIVTFLRVLEIRGY